MQLNVYLNFPGNARDALEFYAHALGSQLTQVMRFQDLPMEGFEYPPEDADKLLHAAIPVAGGLIMVCDVMPYMGQALSAGTNTSISLHVDSKEDADRIFAALAVGGDVQMQLANQPWGDYWGNLTDKFGIQWMVNFPVPSRREE